MSTAADHYEEKFEFPLWKLTKEIAEKKDISYREALAEASLEYGKTINFGDLSYRDKAKVNRKEGC